VTSSLLLAQQSVNKVLEELEDEYASETSTNDDCLPPDQQGEPLTPFVTGRDTVIQRRRNRSQFGNNLSLDRGTLSKLTVGARTSVPLNTHLHGNGEIARASRATIASVVDKRLSIYQSNDLLQHWTDQMGPLAEDITEGTQPLDDHDNFQDTQRMSSRHFL
jgi:hypothetical protein